MDDATPGLRRALGAPWRGGAYAEVLDEGEIEVGASVEWVEAHGEEDTMRRTLLGMLAALLTVMAAPPMSSSAQSGAAPQIITKAQYDRWKTELSNWGRWGKDDQIGAANLITPAKRRQAAALVKEGFSVSLARDVDTEKSVDNPQPYERQMLAIGSDRFGVAFHGVAHTHLDSLAHINYDGVFYNGYKPDADVVMKAGGHARNSIINLKNGILTRGILIDIPRLKGVRYLEPGAPISLQDIEAWEKATGVKVTPGDAVFIRTGRWARRAAVGPWDLSRTGLRPGPSASIIPWLKARDVALLGSDVPPSTAPSDVPGETGPVHDFALVTLGVHLFDNCDLEALADAAAARKRWDFLLTAAPLPIRGGTGSPVNPIATF
jgi:kynurenine formamidase